MTLSFTSISKTLIIVFSIFTFCSVNSQVLNTENFVNPTFLPTGWAGVGGPTNSWSRRSIGTNPDCLPLTDTSMARFASSFAGVGTRQTISTPVIDYSARVSAFTGFSFWMFRDTGSAAEDSMVVYINTSRSLTGATVLGVVARNSNTSLPDAPGGSAWRNYVFSIPTTFNTATNYIMIQGISRRGGNMYLDSIQWSSFPTICTGTPNVGSLILSRHLICGGTGTVNLSLSAPSTDLGIRYQWQSAPSNTGPWTNFGTNATTANSGTISSSTYFQCIVYCDSSGLSDTTNIDSCLVSSGPAPTITFTPPFAGFCTGGSGVSITVSGASTYVWSPSTGLSDSTSATVTANPTSTQRYTVVGTDSFGCTGTGNINVNVQTPPTLNLNINPGDTICTGDSVNIRVMGVGGPGNRYLWSTGDTTRTLNAAPTSNTTYSVTVTTGFGCTGTASTNVIVLSGATPNYSYTISGNTVTFTDLTVGAISWFWDFGDGNTSNLQNPTYTFSTGGAHNVSLTVTAAGCGGGTTNQLINLGTGINDNFNKIGLNIYPNPAQNNVSISYNLTEKQGVLSIENTIGSIVYNENIQGGNQTKNIDLSNLSSGIYYIKIKTSTNITSMKFIKE